PIRRKYYARSNDEIWEAARPSVGEGMRLLDYLRSLGSRFLHRSQTEREMEEELRDHVQHRADDLMQSGLDRVEAERRARIEFGSPERFKEECREELGGNFIDMLTQDVAVR